MVSSDRATSARLRAASSWSAAFSAAMAATSLSSSRRLSSWRERTVRFWDYQLSAPSALMGTERAPHVVLSPQTLRLCPYAAPLGTLGGGGKGRLLSPWALGT